MLTATERLGVAIDEAVAAPAGELVDAYFRDDEAFAGATFDTLGYNDPFKIGPDDLLAVTLLNVSVPAPAVRRILGQDAATIAGCLAAVPAARDLWGASEDDLASADAL